MICAPADNCYEKERRQQLQQELNNVITPHRQLQLLQRGFFYKVIADNFLKEKGEQLQHDIWYKGDYLKINAKGLFPKVIADNFQKEKGEQLQHDMIADNFQKEKGELLQHDIWCKGE